MKGKDKCKALKEIRRQIAEKNDIPYVVSQCKYQGDCLGTCPKCEAELRYLERELAIRRGLGKAAALTACTSKNSTSDPEYEELGGAVEIYDPADEAAPETDVEEPEDDKSGSIKESEQKSPENEDPETAGKIGDEEKEEGIGVTNEPLDTDELDHRRHRRKYPGWRLRLSLKVPLLLKSPCLESGNLKKMYQYVPGRPL